MRALLNPTITTTSVQLPSSICGVSILGSAEERELIEAFIRHSAHAGKSNEPTTDRLTLQDDVFK